MISVLRAVEKAAGKNNEIYGVGGFIRDSLLKRTTQDLDFVVSHAPHQTARNLARLLHARLITLDPEHQVYRLIRPRDKPYIDITGMQGSGIHDDLTRRDFTINAIARHVSKGRLSGYIDPWGGIKDIRSKQIKFINEQSISNDPLRLIRALRFSAELTFTLTNQTKALIRKHRSLIRSSSGERVRDELFKILACRDSGKTIALLDEVGLLTMIIPELEPSRNSALEYYPHGGVMSHCLDSAANMDYIVEHIDLLFGRIHTKIRDYLYAIDSGEFPAFVILKFAALLHDIGKPASASMIDGRLRFFLHEEIGAQLIKQTAQWLKLSNKQSHMLQTVAQAHMRPGNLAYVKTITDRAIHRFFRDYGDNAIGVLLVSLADRFCYITKRIINNKSDRHHRAVLTLLNKYYLKKRTIFPPKLLNGTQLMKALGIPESITVGKLLSSIDEAQSEGTIRTKTQAISLAKIIYKKFTKT